MGKSCLFATAVAILRKEDSKLPPKKIWGRHTTCYESRGGLTDISNAKSNALQLSLYCMPSRLRKQKSRSPLPPPRNSPREMPRPPVLSPGVSTSLDSVQITPRTPRAVRTKYEEASDSLVAEDVEEVEMSLLSGDERSRVEHGFTNGDGYLEDKHKAPIISLEDKRAMVLLCVLCVWFFPLPPNDTNDQTAALRALFCRLNPGCSRASCHYCDDDLS